MLVPKLKKPSASIGETVQIRVSTPASRITRGVCWKPVGMKRTGLGRPAARARASSPRSMALWNRLIGRMRPISASVNTVWPAMPVDSR